MNLSQKEKLSELFGTDKLQSVYDYLTELNFWHGHWHSGNLAHLLFFVSIADALGSKSSVQKGFRQQSLPLIALLSESLTSHRPQNDKDRDIRKLERMEISRDFVAFYYENTTSFAGQRKPSGNAMHISGDDFRQIFLTQFD